MRHGSCRGHPWRGADAGDASGTRPGCEGRSAAPPGPAATVAAIHRGHSAGGQAALGLERYQRACLGGKPQPFLNASTASVPARMTVSSANAPIARVIWRVPARPAADFVVSQDHFPLGRLNATVDGPATARYAHGLCQRGGLRRTNSQRRDQRQPALGIPARPFGAIACAQVGPAYFPAGLPGAC
jgi:hypothetical protein